VQNQDLFGRTLLPPSDVIEQLLAVAS
jgi:hypothetical protein